MAFNTSPPWIHHHAMSLGLVGGVVGVLATEGSGVISFDMSSVLVLSLLMLVYLAIGKRQTSHQPSNAPPSAPLATELPLLGHALAYKRDPPAFLLANAAASQGVFTLNLAGFRTTIVSDPVAMKAIAVAPSSSLSLRHAVADFGFIDALGPLNVFLGSGVHRFVLKARLYPQLSVDASPLIDATRSAVAAYVPSGVESTVDLLPTMRRILLHVSISLFIGPSVLVRLPQFIDDYVEFQDILEEAIAKAVVLPSWLARPLHLKSVATRRRKLVAQLAGVVTDMWAGGASGEMGSWTAAIRTMDRSDLPGYHDLRAAAANSADGPENFTPEDAAEFMIGLLFASHKNPGIGAAQTLMFLLDPVHSAISAAVEKEVLGAASANVYKSSRGRSDEDVLAVTPRLNACVFEALRLCAHSIGAVRKVVSAGGFSFSTTSGDQYVLPEGAYIGISHIVPSHLAAVWQPDAGVFRPFDRFLGRPDGNEPDDYEMTAFSHGVHKCPGRRLATIMMTGALATLLLEFEVVVVGDVPPLSFERATLAQRTSPCNVRFRPRTRGAPTASRDARKHP